MAVHNESQFEKEIAQRLALSGWEYSHNDTGYDRELALFPEDIFAWLSETQPKQFSKVIKASDSELTRQKLFKGLCRRLAQTLDSSLDNGGGTLGVLRSGFKDGAAKFQMCQFRPSDNRNPKTISDYSKVRLRVMRQVHYSQKNEKSIDLVMFINGLPVATVELKTDFTQNVQDAIDQYKVDRDPKGEVLLSFGSRALVHFAVSNSEVFMTTKLQGKSTEFLPFNKGDGGKASNPVNPDGSKTSYLWDEIFNPDTWLEIVGKYMHLSITKWIDSVTGESKKSESLLFPRYHQWKSVSSLVQAVATEGTGHKYLIQHSAGSGKTNSIAWLTHQLSTLHTEDGSKIFDSVIVVTDRTVLDEQLKKAIIQIDHKTGVVVAIDGRKESKSDALHSALSANKSIIVVTIQTFPFIFSVIERSKELHGKKFAIVADEAHSSQAGNTAAGIRNVLSSEELSALDDGGEISIEDILLAQASKRSNPSNLSFFAFTATPKPQTLELFGRPGASGTPEPFHVYSMQQAIEEGFILDVLKNYLPYKLAFKLTHNGQEYDDESSLVVKSDALKALMNWVRLHPTNIGAKVSIIIEHFRENISWRLEGKAKAMVVTGSRKEAVRYKLAFDSYIKANGYKNVNAIVAFSGEVFDPESGPDAFTESNMNLALNGKSLSEAFNTDSFQVMLVANKFQTGFDQPLLTCMYVDKKLTGVNAVQTLSRLNRRAKGKDATFVLDFVNNPTDILEAFMPYYRDAQLSGITDPNVIHDLQSKIDHAGIYNEQEVDSVVQASLIEKSNNRLSAALAPIKERFWHAYKSAEMKQDSEELDRLRLFRSNVSKFSDAYDFLSQLYNYESSDLEKRSIFAKVLAREIREINRNSPIDLEGVNLVKLGFKKLVKQDLNLNGDTVSLDPNSFEAKVSQKEDTLSSISEAVEQMNSLFDLEGITDADLTSFINYVSLKASEDAQIQAQATAGNTLEQFLESPDLKDIILTSILNAQGNLESMSMEVLKDQHKLNVLTKIIGKVLLTRINENSV